MNSVCTCDAGKYWVSVWSNCRKQIYFNFRIILNIKLKKNFFPETYSIYGQFCDVNLLCKPLTNLTCPSTATGCNCPNTIPAGQCDCPTSHFWDSVSLTCVIRSSKSETCTVGKDYMCK